MNRTMLFANENITTYRKKDDFRSSTDLEGGEPDETSKLKVDLVGLISIYII